MIVCVYGVAYMISWFHDGPYSRRLRLKKLGKQLDIAIVIPVLKTSDSDV